MKLLNYREYRLIIRLKYNNRSFFLFLNSATYLHSHSKRAFNEKNKRKESITWYLHYITIEKKICTAEKFEILLCGQNNTWSMTISIYSTRNRPSWNEIASVRVHQVRNDCFEMVKPVLGPHETSSAVVGSRVGTTRRRRRRPGTLLGPWYTWLSIFPLKCLAHSDGILPRADGHVSGWTRAEGTRCFRSRRSVSWTNTSRTTILPTLRFVAAKIKKKITWRNFTPLQDAQNYIYTLLL